MKRTILSPGGQTGSRLGAILLAVALLAGTGQSSPVHAVEPSPAAPAAPATAAATAPATPAPAVPRTTATSVPAPQATPQPAPAQPAPTPTAAKGLPPAPPVAPAAPPAAITGVKDPAAMAAAIGPGGAEMGQRSARVTAKAAGSAARTAESQSAALQALTTQGTWSPSFGVKGMDVSSHQPNVNWQAQWDMGARFAYVKASEGNYFTNPIFGEQYSNSRSIGMIRGAYHFAIPNWSSGADQARYFVANGGGWSSDGYTLPPVLDFEFNPYAGRTISGFYFGNTCYDMSRAQLTSWVQEFGSTMLALTGRFPAIYTNTSWWNQCVGNSGDFADYPLWVAAYPSSATDYAGPVPPIWGNYSMWQYSSTGPFAGDSNVWNGSYAALKTFASQGVPRIAFDSIADVASATSALGNSTSAVICGLRNGGCYQLFDKGAVLWSPATGAQPSLNGPIRDSWAGTGYETGALGYPTSAVICGIRDNGCYQAYQNGEILFSTATGARPTIAGNIRTAYRAAGAENGALGYPTSAELCGIRNDGCYQLFQRGEILSSRTTGAQLVTAGPIRTAYRLAGAENSTYGYPTSGTVCGLRNNGCYQNYETGSIIWSAATGAQPSPKGPIRDAWAGSGYETGPLGYPAGAITCGLRQGGCYQSYEKGAIIWSPATGAQLSPNGPLRTTWAGSGYETGPLGYPTSGVICGIRDNGCYQAYQRGEILYTKTTGAQLSRSGGIRDLYRANAAENGTLAYPTGPEVCGLPNGGCYQNYQGGAIIWSPATGAQLSPTGPIRTAWAKSRYETGPLGYPTTGVVCGLSKNGCYQNYQGGAIIWSPTTGAHLSTTGPIRTLWASTGYETGKLGYPTAAQTCTGTTCTQQFTGGKITYTPARGAYIG